MECKFKLLEKACRIMLASVFLPVIVPIAPIPLQGSITALPAATVLELAKH
jgi:hypothetical protein